MCNPESMPASKVSLACSEFNLCLWIYLISSTLSDPAKKHQKTGANVLTILGHFQKCLTAKLLENIYYSDWKYLLPKFIFWYRI